MVREVASDNVETWEVNEARTGWMVGCVVEVLKEKEGASNRVLDDGLAERNVRVQSTIQ